MPGPALGTCPLGVGVLGDSGPRGLRLLGARLGCSREENSLEQSEPGMGSGGAPGLSVCDPGPAQAPRSLVTSLPLCVFVHFASFRSKRSSEKFPGDLSQAEGEGILLSPG